MVHLPYLQPFEDVDKRVSRLAANIPLIQADLCPLSQCAQGERWALKLSSRSRVPRLELTPELRQLMIIAPLAQQLIGHVGERLATITAVTASRSPPQSTR